MTNDSQNIQSLDQLTSFLENVEQSSAAHIPVDTQVATSEAIPAVMSINSADATVERATIQPSIVITQTIQENIESVPAAEAHVEVPKAPSLKATIDEDREKDKQEGKFEEVKDILLTILRQMQADSQAVASKSAAKVSEILNSAVIDPNNIEISTNSEDPMAVHQQLQIISAATPKIVSPVIALKSGYKADMLALTNADKIDIRNLRGSVLDQTNKILRIIHSKINDTTVGKISYDDFLTLTAEDDYETLLFGIFSATFPNSTEYTLNCPHCDQVQNLPLQPAHLIEVIDKERAGQYIQTVLNGYNKGREFLANSLVAKTERKVLPDSKIIIETNTPTLRNMLANMVNAERMKNQNAELLSITKHVVKMFIPDVAALQQGRNVFHQVTEKEQILGILNKLSGHDMSIVRKAISERVRQYHIEYRIPDFNCASATCGKEIKDVGVDMMNLIFLGIAEEL